MARIPVIIPDEHYDHMRKVAYETKVSMSEQVRNAISEYVSKGRQEEKSKHIKIETINDPAEIRKQLHNIFEGGKIGDA